MDLRKIFGVNDREKDIDIEKYMNDLTMRDSKIIERDDITYVKPIDMDGEGNIDIVLKEMENRNIVVLDVNRIFHKKAILGRVLQQLQDTCTNIDGDIGRISTDKILIVPRGMKILHRVK